MQVFFLGWIHSKVKVQILKIRKYLENKFKGKIKNLKITELGSGVLGTGYSVEFSCQNKKRKVILKSLFTQGLGMDHFSDRARSLLLANDSYNCMDCHVKSNDVIALNKDNSLTSLGNSKEFFILMEEARGVDFFKDFKEIKKRRSLIEGDRSKIKILSDFLVKLHESKNPSVHLYRRKIRDTLGSGGSLMGILDIYPDSEYNLFAKTWEVIVKKTIKFWNKSRNLSHRTTEIHGDFHPGNLWFDNLKLTVLDRAGGRFGEAADDLAAFLINPLFFSVIQTGSFIGMFKEMFDLFWNNYFKQTKDREMRKIIAPYLVFRVAVVCNPLFYPDKFYKDSTNAKETRRRMINFAKNILNDDEFSPEKINYYLQNNYKK